MQHRGVRWTHELGEGSGFALLVSFADKQSDDRRYGEQPGIIDDRLGGSSCVGLGVQRLDLVAIMTMLAAHDVIVMVLIPNLLDVGARVLDHLTGGDENRYKQRTEGCEKEK